jgi:hypothetical protein
MYNICSPVTWRDSAALRSSSRFWRSAVTSSRALSAYLPSKYLLTVERIFEPQCSRDQAQAQLDAWHVAVERSR